MILICNVYTTHIHCRIQCIDSVYTMYIQCVRNVCTVHIQSIQCIYNEYTVYIPCIHRAHTMHSVYTMYIHVHHLGTKTENVLIGFTLHTFHSDRFYSSHDLDHILTSFFIVFMTILFGVFSARYFYHILFTH